MLLAWSPSVRVACSSNMTNIYSIEHIHTRSRTSRRNSFLPSLYFNGYLLNTMRPPRSGYIYLLPPIVSNNFKNEPLGPCCQLSTRNKPRIIFHKTTPWYYRSYRNLFDSLEGFFWVKGIFTRFSSESSL